MDANVFGKVRGSQQPNFAEGSSQPLSANIWNSKDARCTICGGWLAAKSVVIVSA